MSLIGALLGGVGSGRGADVEALLAVLVEHEGQELSVAQAARAGGVAKATASRLVDQLVEHGLVLERRLPRERMISVDVTSPLYEPVTQLLWVDVGASRPFPGHPLLRPDPAFKVGDLELQRLMPDELHAPPDPGRRQHDEEVYDGPLLPVARAIVPRLERIGSRIRVEPDLQRTYRRWRDERDRDLLHLTLHVGAGAAQAARALRAGGQAAPPDRPRVGRSLWVHALYAANAEAVMCQQVAGRLTEAVDRARQLEDAREALADPGPRPGDPQGPDAPTDPDRPTPGAARRRAVDVAAAQEALTGFYRHGGVTDVDSVGRAGERLIAAHLQVGAAEMSQLVHEMAADPSVERWQREHPAATREHPLVPLLDIDLPPRRPQAR